MTNIVLLSYNRPRLLEQTIRTLYANTPHDQFNLVIVDNGSDDFRVKRMYTAWARQYSNISILEITNSNRVLAQQKNVGVAWSEQMFGRGDWLYLSDNDVYFTPGWLEKLTDVTAASESLMFRLWGGQVHPYHQPISTVEVDSHILTEHSVLDGPSWLMRWGTWDEYGPLNRDCASGVCQSEEYPFCQRLRAGTRVLTIGVDPSMETKPGKRIGAIQPHVVYHTGLTNSDGKDAPGRKEREAMIPQGVYTG